MSAGMRHPEIAEQVRAALPVIAAADVPRMEVLRARVQLAVLGTTAPGDVFYLVTDPSRVYLREDSRFGGDEVFLELGDEVWRPMKYVGTGQKGQRVVVLHNTKDSPQGA